ncbi:MAG TPA: glycosyltransferase family 4 protein [Solirubrobacteraceae bacterium]
MKPVLFVTSHAPPERIGAFGALHERELVHFALFGGRSKHGADEQPGDLPFPHSRVKQSHLAALAASGDYRAVVCSTGGRVALPAAWSGARRARVPLILWSSLWAHPRTAAHAVSYLALRRLYRSADAVVTYGPHVSAYVRARGARNVHVAPQSVDNGFWSAPAQAIELAPAWPAESRTNFLFVGRPDREKGLRVLLMAWRASGLSVPTAALVLVGVGSAPPGIPADGAVGSAADETRCVGRLNARQLRNFYAAADVLVVPSIPTRTFREPWGLVINEAMNQHVPIIASDAVGAVAGGLVRDGHNGLVVRASDSQALAAALRKLALDGRLRSQLGRAGARDVLAYNHEAWASGFSRALHSLGASRIGC